MYKIPSLIDKEREILERQEEFSAATGDKRFEESIVFRKHLINALELLQDYEQYIGRDDLEGRKNIMEEMSR